MNKDNIIVISTFPNTLEKISFLQEQLYYFSKLKIPILVISGCDVPSHLNFMIDYLIINKENEQIGCDFIYKCIEELKLPNTAYPWISIDSSYLCIYTPSVNSTITKNIKLSLKTAQTLGYKNVFFTEDDNIFKDGSFEFVKKQFQILSEGQYKLITGAGSLDNLRMLYITYFFTNIDFFLDRFIIPHEKEDWYNSDNIVRFKLNYAYECLFYDLFKNDMDKFLDITDDLAKFKANGDTDDGKAARMLNEMWLLNNFTNVFVDINKNKYIILSNQTSTLKDKKKEKNYHADIYINDVLFYSITLHPSHYQAYSLNNDVKHVRIKIDDVLDKTINVDYDIIKFNGLLTFN
jgi:hypothetical protein